MAGIFPIDKRINVTYLEVIPGFRGRYIAKKVFTVILILLVGRKSGLGEIQIFREYMSALFFPKNIVPNVLLLSATF